jgi:Signal transduction histidine kinase
MKVKFIVALVVHVLLGKLSMAQQQILFRKYSVVDGLCSNTVWCISQDAKGYMWFGTKNGLNRFDGYEFKTYKFRKSDTNSLGNNFIHAICAYDSTNYWIGTEDGVYNLNLETERFTRVPGIRDQVVYDIIRDRKGTMWVATNKSGLYGYRRGTHKTIHFTNVIHIRNLEEDAEGRIWMGSFGRGIVVLDPGSMKLRQYSLNKGDINSNKIFTVYRDLAGNMWAGSLGGLHVLRKDSDSFTTYLKGGPGSINDNIVRSIYQPSPQKLYIGTEKGLNILDLTTQQFTAYTNKANDPHSISDNAVYSIFPDKEGGIWVGTYFGGLNYFAERRNNFELYYTKGEAGSLSGNAVSCFLEDKPGYFWIGTENAGLNYFDAHTRKCMSYPFAPGQQSLSYHNIHSLLKDNRQRLWIGTFSAGLNVYDPATGKVKTYQHNPRDTTSISSNNIYTLYKDREGVIWVGTTDGLNTYDPAIDAFHRVKVPGLSHNIYYNILEDDNNTIWFITYDKGLIGKHKTTGRWVHYTADGRPQSLSSNKIISIHDDGAGHLWLGTDGGGLNCFDKREKTFRVYDETAGVSGNVYGILQDDANHLWLSTNDGIIRFSLETKSTRVFTNLDNLQSNQFNYNAALKASDGRLYFGGVNGFNVFHPDSLHDEPIRVQPAITNFRLFNEVVDINKEGSPFQKEIGFVDKMVLSHHQSVLSFEYAALSYLAPNKIQYAYLMEGFDKDWNYVGNQRKATYTNLPPGTYIFKVKSTDIYGNWNSDTAAMTLVVKPPFYRTVAAYCVYALLLAGGVVLYRRQAAKRTRKKQQAQLERMEAQREREFYNQKIEFFTTMAHEIRTPLSLIMAPLETLKNEEDWTPEVKEQLNRMDENADRLLNLVNQLLDFRRIESDVYTIRTEEMELIAFIHSLYSRFSAMSSKKGIRFAMSTSINKLTVQADPEAITKILTNLLINAFKFARSKVAITINEIIKGDDNKSYFSVSVIDDGIGIPASQLQHVFKAFYKVNNDATHSNMGGTGIGLALAKSLAEKHGGRLEVESREGVETNFTLFIPFESIEVMSEPVTLKDEPVILVVEDDPSMLDFISKSLHRESYSNICASNGMEALQMLEKHSVQLIISDVMMPGMEGIEFCRQVKNNINYSHIPLVLLTAKSNSESEIAGIENGADAYITKPFKWKHVTVVIKNLLLTRERLSNRFAQQPFTDVNALTTNAHDAAFIEKLVAVIQSRITDPQLSVEELSREMSMSRSSLGKKLKAMSGYVPNEFIRVIRLKQAAKLLLHGGHSISEVGYMTGFGSPSYFSRCFVHQFKVTPSEFVEKYKNKQAIDWE